MSHFPPHLISRFICCEPLITELPQRIMKGSPLATYRCLRGEIHGTFCLKWDRSGKLMCQYLLWWRNKITRCSEFYFFVHLCNFLVFYLLHFRNLICKNIICLCHGNVNMQHNYSHCLLKGDPVLQKQKSLTKGFRCLDKCEKLGQCNSYPVCPCLLYRCL